MSPLYLHNNKILVVGGKLAANEACCCCSCPPCNENFLFSVTWAGVTATANICFDGGYFGLAQEFTDVSFVVLNVSASCEDGNWILATTLCYQEGECNVASTYSVTVPCAETDPDQFPPTGAVTLVQEFYNATPEGCGPGGPTAASVAK